MINSRLNRYIGNLYSAKLFILKAIKLETKTYGAGHPTLATLYSNLGGVYIY